MLMLRYLLMERSMTNGTVFTWPLRHTCVTVASSFMTSLLVSPLPDPPCKPHPNDQVFTELFLAAGRLCGMMKLKKSCC